MRDTIANLEELLKSHGITVYECAADQFSLHFEGPTARFLNGARFEARLGYLFSICREAGMPTTNVMHYLRYIDAKNIAAKAGADGNVVALHARR